MQGLIYIKLSEKPEWIDIAARWFCDKWGVPQEAYKESMEQSSANLGKIPQWYIVLDVSNRIIAGVGIIENDFHQRKDLAPNLCALYVEIEYRKQGIARSLLDICLKEANLCGCPQLYLITDHTEFYEKCGWEFLTMVKSDDGEQERMYVAKQKKQNNVVL